MLPFFGTVYNGGVGIRFDETLNGLDVLAAAGAKAEVMKAGTVLVEASAPSIIPMARFLVLRCFADENSGSAANSLL